MTELLLSSPPLENTENSSNLLVIPSSVFPVKFVVSPPPPPLKPHDTLTNSKSNIFCAEVICPPNSNWRENVQIAIGCDAAAIIVDVLKLHPGNEDVLDRCASSLSHLCHDQATAEQIADQGGVAAIIASIDANKNISAESLVGGLRMIESVMNHPTALSKIVNQDLVNKIIDIMNSHLDDPTIMLSCMRALEKIAKTSEGLDLIQNADGIRNILNVLDTVAGFAEHGEDDVDIIKRATNILGRMAKSGDIIRMIKEAGGVDIYLKVLDAFKDDERIARLGGKFLSRVTGDSVDELIAILNEKGASAAMIERTMALLASLAMVGNSSVDIVNGGGCPAITSHLEKAVSDKALESTCRALARLARNAKNIQLLVDSNVIPPLVASLSHKFSSSESRAQAIDAL